MIIISRGLIRRCQTAPTVANQFNEPHLGQSGRCYKHSEIKKLRICFPIIIKIISTEDYYKCMILSQ